MRIYIPNTSSQSIGGGWTFLRNFQLGAKGKATFVTNWKDCDVVFIMSATTTDRDEIKAAKAAGKKIVFRIDNMPKDSRNRGTAFSRVRDFGILADQIIFQSEWAKKYVGNWLRFVHKAPAMENATVIYNGVDTSVFNFSDTMESRPERYIFVHYNRDENKRFPEAAYDFSVRHFNAKNQDMVIPELLLVGRFSPELAEYNFDFFNGEVVNYVGPVEDREGLADLYRSCKYLYFPAFADAAPNTVAEAIACGCKVLLVNPVGGSQEMVDVFSQNIITVQDMADKYLELMANK